MPDFNAVPNVMLVCQLPAPDGDGITEAVLIGRAPDEVVQEVLDFATEKLKGAVPDEAYFKEEVDLRPLQRQQKAGFGGGPIEA